MKQLDRNLTVNGRRLFKLRELCLVVAVQGMLCRECAPGRVDPNV